MVMCLGQGADLCVWREILVLYPIRNKVMIEF